MSKTDYCVSTNDYEETNPHTATKTDNGGEGKSLPSLVGYGGSPSKDDLPLQECEGDCDDDSEVSAMSATILLEQTHEK